MTIFLLTKRAAEELHVDSDELGAVMRVVLDRIVGLAKYSETDVSNLMQTQAGHQLVNLNVVDLEGGDTERHSSDWDGVVLATPEPLSDAEYARVLLGKDPKATSEARPVELYGAHQD
jgi:hypothetical protein